MKRNITIDDTSPLISYYSPTSSWHRSEHSDPKLTEYYLSGYFVSKSADDSATFFFIGTGAWIYGALRSNHGLYNVTLDGVTITRDGHAPGEGLYQQVLFAASNLTLGPHTITLTNNRNSDYYTNLDLDFIVFEEDLGGSGDIINRTIVEDDEVAFAYGPDSNYWNTHPDSISSYHSSSGHITVHAAAYVDYSFNGSAVSIFGALGPCQGSYSVSLDRGPATIYTAYIKEPIFGQILYHVTGLTAGTHTVRLTNMPGNSGGTLSIDYALVDSIQVPIGVSSSTSIISMTSASSTTRSSSTSIVSTTSTSSTIISSTTSIISANITSSSTTLKISTSSASSTTSSNTTAALLAEANVQLSSVGVSALFIVGAVLCGLAIFTMLGFALMIFRRWRESRKGLDDRSDMEVIRPEPYLVGFGKNRGSGRYMPPGLHTDDGDNHADSGGVTLHSPDRNPRDTNAPGYFGQHIDGTSLFSGLAPAQPPLSGHSNSTHQQKRQQRRLPSPPSTGLPYIQSDVASISRYSRSTTYSDSASHLPAHGHSKMTDPSLIPLLRISPQ